MQRQAEMGAMYPQATERLQPPETKTRFSHRGVEGQETCCHLLWDFLLSTESTFLVLPGAQLAWSQQPRDTKIGLVSPQHSTSGLLHLPSQTWTCGGTQPAAKL